MFLKKLNQREVFEYFASRCWRKLKVWWTKTLYRVLILGVFLSLTIRFPPANSCLVSLRKLQSHPCKPMSPQSGSTWCHHTSNDSPGVSFVSVSAHLLQLLGGSFIIGEDKGNSDQCAVNDFSPLFPLIACFDAHVLFQPFDGVVKPVVECSVRHPLHSILSAVVHYEDETWLFTRRVDSSQLARHIGHVLAPSSRTHRSHRTQEVTPCCWVHPVLSRYVPCPPTKRFQVQPFEKVITVIRNHIQQKWHCLRGTTEWRAAIILSLILFSQLYYTTHHFICISVPFTSLYIPLNINIHGSNL